MPSLSAFQPGGQLGVGRGAAVSDTGETQGLGRGREDRPSHASFELVPETELSPFAPGRPVPRRE